MEIWKDRTEAKLTFTLHNHVQRLSIPYLAFCRVLLKYDFLP